MLAAEHYMVTTVPVKQDETALNAPDHQKCVLIGVGVHSIHSLIPSWTFQVVIGWPSGQYNERAECVSGTSL
jgi:hypothetical protein